MRRKKVHLVCNAHLDPVWLWEWQEGAAETISTFRTAAEFCEEFDDFVFNHNEVILYKWIEEYAPDLFKRIQKLVKKGKWNIMGGWYLQPDCNMPSGESFVRQVLLGKNYFKEKFGVDVTTAINFDPFGHSRGLVQILAKSGYDSYLFLRPRPWDEEFVLASNEFVWVGYDGSEVMGKRFTHENLYASDPGKGREKIEQCIKDNPDKTLDTVLWGVGNHGGGPSRIDIRRINQLIRQSKDLDILHSTPQAYFKDLRRVKDKLPKHKADINPWAVGCYSSMVRIKQRHRLLENEIYSLEKMACAAAVQGLMKYPSEEIQQALCDLMFCEFHDILPGSCIQPAEDAALRLADHGIEITSRLKARAFFALASGQRKAGSGKYPVLVHNPHPFRTEQIIECEFNLAGVNRENTFTNLHVYHDGKALPCQVEKEDCTLSCELRKKVAFRTYLEPGQVNRFDCVTETMAAKPSMALKSKKDKILFKTKDLDMVINTRTGLVDRYKVNGRNCLNKKAFEPVVIADNEDPWGMTVYGFRKTIGKFRLMSKGAGTRFSGIKNSVIDSVRIIEDGPVRSIIEAVFAYGDSFLCQRYKLPKVGTEIEVETRVHWNEKDCMLKLSVPTVGYDCKCLGQVAYGIEPFPNNGNETISQKWLAVVSKENNTAFTCINNGIYGSDFSKDGLRLTLLRSPAYSCHPDGDGTVYMPADRYSPRIDQGERIFRFWFNAGKIKARLDTVDREALVKNEKPYVLSFFPSGEGKKPKPLAVLSDNIVQITAIKQAEKNKDIIVRLFEPTGKSRSTVLSLPIIPKKIKISLGGFEIKTLRINTKTGKYREVNLLEKAV